MEESGEKKSLVPNSENRTTVDANANGPRVLKRVLQVFHFILALSVLVVGLVEFCVEPTIFDVFSGIRINRNEIPKAVFKVSERMEE